MVGRPRSLKKHLGQTQQEKNFGLFLRPTRCSGRPLIYILILKKAHLNTGWFFKLAILTRSLGQVRFLHCNSLLEWRHGPALAWWLFLMEIYVNQINLYSPHAKKHWKKNLLIYRTASYKQISDYLEQSNTNWPVSLIFYIMTSAEVWQIKPHVASYCLQCNVF